MPVIKLREEVYRRLRELKARLGHGSFNETVAYLLDRAADPRSFLESLAFFMEDVMRDVKRIADQLEALDRRLSALAGLGPRGGPPRAP